MLAIKAYLYFHPTLTTNYKNRMERRYIVKYILFIVHSRILHYDAFLNVNIKYTKILSYKYTRLPKNFDILIYSRKAKSYCNPQTHLIFARWLRLIELMMIFNHSFYFDGISIARLQITFICLFEHAKSQKSFVFFLKQYLFKIMSHCL